MLEGKAYLQADLPRRETWLCVAECEHPVPRAAGRAAYRLRRQRPLQPRGQGQGQAAVLCAGPEQSIGRAGAAEGGRPSPAPAAAHSLLGAGPSFPGPAAGAPRPLLLFGKKKARLPVRPKCAFQLLCISSALNGFKESTERNGLQCFKKS